MIARGGFDPNLALFDNAGALVRQNDDGGTRVHTDSATGSRYNSFMQLTLTPGGYTVAKPETYSMLPGGIGALAFLMRRRKKATA